MSWVAFGVSVVLCAIGANRVMDWLFDRIDRLFATRAAEIEPLAEGDHYHKALPYEATLLRV